MAAWPAIHSGHNALIAAPTRIGQDAGARFMAAIDALVRKGVAGELADATHVVYVSPLKALSNDIQRNLEQPLGRHRGGTGAPRCAALRDPRAGSHRRHDRKPSGSRCASARRTSWLTTPESLYLLAHQRIGRSDAVDGQDCDRR